MEFKKRLLIIIGIPVGVCVILTASIIFLGFHISDKAKAANENRFDLVTRLAIADSLASLKKDSEQIKNYSSVLENVMPHRDRLVLFPRDLNALGKQNNLDINVTLGQGAASESNSSLWHTSFRITGNGPLNDLANFIKSFSVNRYLISLKSIDFVREGDNFKTLLDGQVYSM